MRSASTWSGSWRCGRTRCWCGNRAIRPHARAHSRAAPAGRSVPHPANEDVATALRDIGRLPGTSEIAERAAADYERRIRELRDLYRDRARVFIEVDDRPLYTVNGKQIISEIVELCGGRNVFADLNELAPAISIEAVIAANPQAIISTDDTVPDAAAEWERWRHIEAVRTGNVYTLRSDDIARATTRLTVAAESVCRTLDSETALAGRRPALTFAGTRAAAFSCSIRALP